MKPGHVLQGGWSMMSALRKFAPEMAATMIGPRILEMDPPGQRLSGTRSSSVIGASGPEDPPAYGLGSGHTWMPEVEMSLLMKRALKGDAPVMNYHWAGPLPRR